MRTMAGYQPAKVSPALMRTLVFLFVLSAGPFNTTIGQNRNYRGQHQDEKQEYNGFNWHRCHLPERN